MEVLLSHIFSNRTPILALNGRLGDGKSSVLELLRSTISDNAIVVSFSAWLPGSESSLAVTLFRDIATECNKVVYVPLLKKRALDFARAISGSVTHLSGLREFLPVQSQWQEIEEVRYLLSRVPRPVVVLLDEIDRMQKDEVLTLLKVLRGAGAIPNVTFLCAFDGRELRRVIEIERADYLEKFFPVSIPLADTSDSAVQGLALRNIDDTFGDAAWFFNEKRKQQFLLDVEAVWREMLGSLCINFRKLNMLLNNLRTAIHPVMFEVDPLDLLLAEALRTFTPDTYDVVRRNGPSLVGNAFGERGAFVSPKMVKTRQSRAATELKDVIGREPEDIQEPCTKLISWLFPSLRIPGSDKWLVYRHPLASGETSRRIEDPNHFSLYFKSVLPSALYSNALFGSMINVLECAKTPSDLSHVLARYYDFMRPEDPRREDFLWRLGQAIERVPENLRVELSRQIATRADQYTYDKGHFGEAGRAVNMIFNSAGSLQEAAQIQEALESGIRAATNDDFANRVLFFSENPHKNEVFYKWQYVNVPKLTQVFSERMRLKYVGTSTIELSKANPYVFRKWASLSDVDRRLEQDFWRTFIGRDRKKLAQAVDFMYPFGHLWQDVSPVEWVDLMFPVAELCTLARELDDDSDLTEGERAAIQRLLEAKATEDEKSAAGPPAI